MKHLTKFKIFEADDFTLSNQFVEEIKDYFTDYVIDECNFELHSNMDNIDINPHQDEHNLYYEIKGFMQRDWKTPDYIIITILGDCYDNWINLKKPLKNFLSAVSTHYEYKIIVLSGHTKNEMDLDQYFKSSNDSTYIGSPLEIKIFYK
jgi:hypothetical protein